ncbi:hypothetical protein J5N97_024549 [Dioscorea zingiberensis]|uniref:F-box domain-containing protein n=1 Tax=Dioscorea zingiberensis TaxID=325984 RepID=A0A9D5C839_9LILI|nr:hypothetical protein J5N97_024549 [Dioscorea zingiberensis]
MNFKGKTSAAWGVGARSIADPSGDGVREEEVHSRGWADLPDGLLEDLIRRVEADATAWPARRDVVACAGVCRPWRTKTLELARRWTPLDSDRITFPDSLKLPGYAAVSCGIQRLPHLLCIFFFFFVPV